MANITISSLNVRGLGNNKKRRETFQWLRKKNYSIYRMQEVHRTEKSFGTWAAECGYTALFNGLATNKAGVAILFNNNFTFKVLKQLCDKEGRYIIIDLVVGELTLTICSIYAPSKDDPAFFQNVSEQMTSLNVRKLSLGGILTLFWMFGKTKRAGNQVRIKIL